MPLVPAEPPAPTPEFDALVPREGDGALDPLTRIGDGVVAEFHGADTRDSRPNKKLPRQLAGLVALRAQGFDNHEIAERLDVSPRKLKALIAQARREYGWNDLGDKLVNVALPQAVDNIVKHLEQEGTTAAVEAGESTMTREIARGLGVFKTHAAVKQETKKTTLQILRVEVTLPELPPGDQGAAALSGSVMATPRRALSAASHPAPVATPIDGVVVE